MTGRSDRAVAERLDLLDALVYADVFGSAVTFEELWRYGRVRVDGDELRARLRDDPSIRDLVSERDGLYCLEGRESVLGLRAQRVDRARTLARRADRVARILRHAPFVRGLALTGSTAAGAADDRADVDLLVVVRAGRLATVFVLLGTASRVVGRRLFCPNYYVVEGRLGLPPGSVYVARELVQARTLVGDGDALRSANPWLADVFPNADAPARGGEVLRARGTLQRLLELPLRRALGDRLEARARRLAAARLRAHYGARGRGVPAEVSASLESGDSLRFHGRQVDETTLERYASRRRELEARLEPDDRGAAAPAGATGR